MKRLICSALALAISLAAPVFAQQSEVIDGIAAVVNGDVITYSQVRELIGARERALRASFQGAELENKIKEMRLAALKDLVDRQLIIQEFKKKEKDGASIPAYVLDDRVQTIIREEFGGDRSAFVRTLKSQGYTITKFKQIERDKIIVQAMRQSYVKDDFVISPTQIQNYYEKHKLDYSTPEQVKLRMIVLREDGNSDTGLAGGKKEMANEIRSKLTSGAEFGRMAQMYSEDPTTQQADGDWGWVDKKTLSEALTARAFALRAGEISDVIEVGNSYYIMLVEARKNAAVKPIGEVRDEIEQNLIQQEKTKELQRWLDTLRQSAYIKIYS
ncbi:MAG: peptidyl-prolyl cis-trans isomerase [Terrimicrobiaceae bacterium]|nr:peptidyl-prolyl cis-trans isomerase [Terrimicrobiaceae bacterium]